MKSPVDLVDLRAWSYVLAPSHEYTSVYLLYSNGLLDPWSAGGVLESISDTLVAVIIPDGAHHLDLRSKNKADPPSVIAARNTEKAFIKKWIAKANV